MIFDGAVKSINYSYLLLPCFTYQILVPTYCTCISNMYIIITYIIFIGVLLNFSEPLDAALPTRKWRLYVFKGPTTTTGGGGGGNGGDEEVKTFHIHRMSRYLFGRDSRVADVLLENPSCSKQHAVLQYRSVIPKAGADNSGSWWLISV